MGIEKMAVDPVSIYGSRHGSINPRGFSNGNVTRATTKVNWGPTGISVSVSLNDNLKRLLFASKAVRGALVQGNLASAKQIQSLQVKDLQRSIDTRGRAQEGRNDHQAGALLEAWESEENILVSANQITVGRPVWMDRSNAKQYWRIAAVAGNDIQDKKVWGYFSTGGASVGPGGTMFDARLMYGKNAKGKRKWEIIYHFFQGYNFVDRGFRDWLLIGPEENYRKAFAEAGLDFKAEFKRSNAGADYNPVLKRASSFFNMTKEQHKHFRSLAVTSDASAASGAGHKIETQAQAIADRQARTPPASNVRNMNAEMSAHVRETETDYSKGGRPTSTGKLSARQISGQKAYGMKKQAEATAREARRQAQRRRSK
jgi:hypothetical protein